MLAAGGRAICMPTLHHNDLEASPRLPHSRGESAVGVAAMGIVVTWIAKSTPCVWYMSGGIVRLHVPTQCLQQPVVVGYYTASFCGLVAHRAAMPRRLPSYVETFLANRLRLNR